MGRLYAAKNGKPLYLTLSDGSDVSLIGRVDRIDSDGEHAFITDYKSGTPPTGSAMEQGLDLQLPVYLLAVAALSKEQLVKDYIEKIYAGDFALAGCRRCDVYCPLHDICRVQLVSGDGGQGGESDE